MKPTSDQLRQWGKLGGVAKGGLKGKASRANGKLGGRCWHVPNNPDVMQTICLKCVKDIEPKEPGSDQWIVCRNGN